MRPWGQLLGVALLACSCAQVAQITGGEKDTIPPELVDASPPNGSTRFSAEVIHLLFDERIQLDRPRERLLVSPPLAEPPVVRAAGSRGVDIRIGSPLEPNTTYTFELGECVKDLAEGNAAPSLAYVFTTGDVLDSLTVTGTVVNAYTGVAEKDMFVMVYTESDTAFRVGRPGHMTRCDSKGTFTIQHLPANSYHLFALRDKNANFRYDLPNEEIAFLDSLYVTDPADSVAPAVVLRAFLPASSLQQVRSYKVIPDGAFQLVLAKPADTLSIRDVAREGGTLSWQSEWGPGRDTVLLWPSDTTLLTQGAYAVADGSTILDTLRYKPLQRMPFNTAVKVSLMENDEGASIRIRAARPIKSLDTSRFIVMRDSTLLDYRMERSTSDTRSAFLMTDIKAGASLSITLLPKAIRDIYGGVNDTLRITLGRAAEQATGSLRIAVKGIGPQYNQLLQVLDGQQRLVEQAQVSDASPNALWDRMLPGMYTLRLVEDRNGNGHWDTGTWEPRVQPERVRYHTEPLNVRAAWDVGLDWVLE